MENKKSLQPNMVHLSDSSQPTNYEHQIKQGFTLSQPAQSHHNMKLRSQTNIAPAQPTMIPPDHHLQTPFDTSINSYPTTNYSTSHPYTSPHLIPPDSPPYSLQPTNFKNMAVNAIVADHLFNSHTVHHVFNAKTGERETMDTLLNGIHGLDWTQS